MARKAKPTPETPEIETPGLPAMAELNSDMDRLAAQYNEDRDLANQLLGQAQMANAIAKFSDVVTLSKLKTIKENKLYRALAGQKAISPDGKEISDVGTFEGFCQAIGLSYSKVHEDLQNLAVFGEQALENLSRIGVGYRELRQYRRLPEDEKLALIEVAKAGDKEAFAELAETIIAKHADEKTKLKKEAEEAKADYEAQLQVSKKKEELINGQQRELAKLRRRLAEQTPDELGETLRREVAGVGYRIEGQISQDLAAAFDQLAEHAEENGCTHEEFMSGLLFGIERALLAIRNKHNVKEVPDGNERPDWTREDFDADAVVAAALAKEAGHA